MFTMLEQQKLARKRLSLNREKLKAYCGQLDLERIDEDPTNKSPRDQQQILLSSYRSQSLQQQQQIPKGYKLNQRKQKMNVESSFTVDVHISPPDDTKPKRVDEVRASLKKQVSINLPELYQTPINQTTTPIQPEQNMTYQRILDEIETPKKVQKTFSPSQFEEGTGKMSPLSQVKKLLKQDLNTLKSNATDVYFQKLTQKQIQLLDQSKRSPSPKLVDPIVYFENRYFPLGFDDPSKLIHLKHGGANNQSRISNQQSQKRPDGGLNQIRKFEVECDQFDKRLIESTIEVDFDKRVQRENQMSGTFYPMDKKYSTLETKKGFIDKYVRGSGMLSTQQMQSKNQIRGLNRGGLGLLSASVAMSPGSVNQWAAQANLPASRDTPYTAPKSFLPKVAGNLIMSGETILGDQHSRDAMKKQRLNQTIALEKGSLSPTSVGDSIHKRIASLTATASNTGDYTAAIGTPATMRNNSINRLKSVNTNQNQTIRKSRDLREELLNQRQMTSLRLESVNIKVPKVWHQKEEAYQRFKEMKQSVAQGSPRVVPLK